MDNIIVSFNVIAPVFFLMVLGYFLVNYTSLADGKLTKQANAIVFKISLPCMLFYNVYQSDIGSEIHSRIRLCIWAAGGLLILFVLLCLIVPRIVTQENQQGVVIQGIFRSNYVIFGVAVVQNMYGPKSTMTAAILSAILVPMYNFLAVVALSIFGEKRENDWKKIILDIIKNPLIISSVLGIIFSLLGIRLPTAVDTTVQDLAKLSTPIAFMILGGDLDFSKVKGNLKTAFVVLTIKLVNLPAYHDSDGGYDRLPGCGPVVRGAGISDAGCSIQLYHGAAGGSGWTACRAAGCVLIGAFDIYVVCDDIHIADDGAACFLVP